MAGRTAYACEKCQPLRSDIPIPASRAAALQSARPAQEFVSHCAMEDPGTLRACNTASSVGFSFRHGVSYVFRSFAVVLPSPNGIL